MFHHWMDGMWFGWIFWIIIIAVVVWLIINRNNRSKHNLSGETPLDILKKRYAKGEILKEEYEERKRTLES